jgi:hypothetical protein
MSHEEWRGIVGYEGLYQVSNTGKVRSAHHRRIRELKPTPQSGGYLLVTLCKNKIKKGESIHALVALAFIGPRPTRMTINHKNGNKADNRSANLEYVTHKENTHHAMRLGLMNNKGENNGSAKLSQQDAETIRSRYNNGDITQRQLAEEYGVCQGTITQIVCNKIWN